MRGFVCHLTGYNTNRIELCWKAFKAYILLRWWKWKFIIRLLRYCKIFAPVSIEHLETYLNAWLFVYNLQQAGTHPDMIVDEILSCFVWVNWLCHSNRIFSDDITWKTISFRNHCESINLFESPHHVDIRQETEN